MHCHGVELRVDRFQLLRCEQTALTQKFSIHAEASGVPFFWLDGAGDTMLQGFSSLLPGRARIQRNP